MSDEIRVNRPQAQPAPQTASMPQELMQKTSAMPWIILAVVVVVIIVLGIVFRGQLFGKGGQNGKAMTTPTTGASSGYQAVFLSNGQVYFGKISNQSGDYITLKDIYYLQVVQQPPLQGTPQAGQAPVQPQQSISLVKLGEELHGPVDEMHINRTQVLFYEDLKTAGQVVKAIQDYKAKQAAPAK